MYANTRTSIHIRMLGSFTYDIEKILKRLKNNYTFSELFMVQELTTITDIPEPKNPNEYTPNDFLSVLQEPTYSGEILLGFIDKEIIDSNKSIFCFPISERSALISVYDMPKFLKNNDLNMYNYILIMIYRFAILKHINYDFTKNSFQHPNVKHCLLAVYKDKNDIIQVLNDPDLCNKCRSEIDKKPINPDFYAIIRKEFKRIKKSTYYSIKDWIESHPIRSLIIFCVVTILLNLLSNFIFEFCVK